MVRKTARKLKVGRGWPYSDKDGSVPSAPPATKAELERLQTKEAYAEKKEAALEFAKRDAATLDENPKNPEGGSKRLRRKHRGGNDELYAAVENGDAEHVAQLLTPDITPAVASSLLMQAAREGHAEVARVLLDHGASTEVTDTIGYTPLMWAAFRDYADVVEVLVSRGANVAAKGSNGKTAMELAESREVRTLLHTGSFQLPSQSGPVGARRRRTRKRRARKVKQSY